MDNLVKLVWSPFIPPLEVVGDIVIKLHFPCSDASVTVQVNPNTQEYQEIADTKDVQVRQVMLTTTTEQKRELSFDFDANKTHNINIEGCNYEIELMNIGKENIEGQDWTSYEFNVSTG